MEWYLKVLRQYADFEGRARRTEYWTFFLFNFIISFLISIVVAATILIMRNSWAVLLSYLYMFAVMIPSLAVTVRRLHDTGRSAWFLFVLFIPFVGGIWLFILSITEGTPGKNQYGDNPKTSGLRMGFDRNKSVAVALIISSFVWLLSQLLFCIINSHWDVSLILYCSIPVGLVVTGFLLLNEGKFTNYVAYALIITSAVWLIVNLNLSGFGFSFHMIIDKLTLIIPVALMILAISVLEKKNDRIIVPVLLIVGFCMNLISHIYAIFMHYNDIKMEDLLLFTGNAAYIMTPVSFLVLAMYLLYNRKVEMLKIGKNGFVKPENTEYGQTRQVVACPDNVKNTGQNNGKNAPPNNSGKVYYERDNKGMRIETSSQSMVYWMVERVRSLHKDPFVYYCFKNEYDARAALLKLPFIHATVDSRKLICDELFRYGYYAVTNDGQLTGEYDAFISGADYTYDMWEQTHVAFSRHNGVKKNDMEPERKTSATASSQSVAGNAKNVTFIREDRDADSVWIVYKAPCKADAMAFLSRQQIVRSLYYVVVETPEGNFGRDKDGFYQE
jgi:uncharacterized membrane protein YhaH (DUF805 family)